MKISSIRAITGPNIYSYRPILVMRLHLEELTGKESCDVSGFNERLLRLLPGVRNHHCSKGRPGGFVEWLEESASFGHIVEHVALELTDLVGIGTFHGKTLAAGAPGVYNLVIEYKAEKGAEFLIRKAVEVIESLLRGESFLIDETLAAARDILARTELGPNTFAIVEAAKTSATSAVGVDIASDKELTKALLGEASIPVPHGVLAGSKEGGLGAFEDFDAPVVVKSFDGCQGKVVSLNFRTAEQVRQAFQIARQYSSQVLVEALLEGRDHRVLVVNGRVRAASERLPARGDCRGALPRERAGTHPDHCDHRKERQDDDHADDRARGWRDGP